MAKYIVGTLKNGGDIASSLILQDASIALESDVAEVQDENGNVAYVQHYNHRAVITANAVVGKGQAVPTLGATVSLKGITLPSPAADGSMSSPTVTLAEDATTGDGVDFLITSASLATSNTDVPKYALTLTRYLENSIGAIKTATA